MIMLRYVSGTALNPLLDHIINIAYEKSYLKTSRKSKKALYFDMAQKEGHP
jgi:hypothetical protein